MTKLRFIKEMALWMAYGELLSIYNTKKWLRVFRHGYKTTDKGFRLFIKALESDD